MRTTALLALIVSFPVFAHASVVVSEIMYDVPGADTGREWVEVTNIGDTAADMSKYKFFEANINHTLIPISGNGVLLPGSSAIIADDPTKFKIDWPKYIGALFNSSFSLSNTGESFSLKDGALVTLDFVSYDPSLGAVGDGNTLQRRGSRFVSAAPTPGTYAEVSSAAISSATVIPTVSVSVPQPSVPVTGYKNVQKIDQVTSIKKNIKTNEEAIRAPTVTTELVTVGANVPPSVSATRASGIFHSPWTLGLLGVILLAAGAFILL